MDLLPNFNLAALDYMRGKLSDHQEFQNLSPVDKLIYLDMIEAAISYYLDGCLRHNSPGSGVMQ